MQRGTSYFPRLRYNPRHAQAAYRRRACVARVRASSAALRPSARRRSLFASTLSACVRLPRSPLSVRVGRAYTGVTAARSRVRASCTVRAG
ncbi:hypothetical protein EXIGLDRAFT_720616 [Exidia glandulosa HHB12029]|uniref:Uncharacterized protein n=1 Tax=Exidia glandulosa HHB12029 TaxID=1314781 RepID=A0A165GA38_EXIGL|nr:hypothetical protein EXIGLDRAFT_720616 [Exidia glandulosa HHB12029]